MNLDRKVVLGVQNLNEQRELLALAVAKELAMLGPQPRQRVAGIRALRNLAVAVGVGRDGPALTDGSIGNVVAKYGFELAAAPDLLVEDGLDAEVQAQAEQICGTYLGTSDFYTSSKTQRALDRERLTDATMLIVYSLTALFGIIGISSAAVAILNSLYQRRKEFAMLRSVGLDRKGLDRLLHIEGFFLGGKPLVIGLPILFLIAAVLMWMQDVTFMEFIQVFPLLGLAAYIVLVLMVISGIYRAASRRIRRDIIVEVLKDENV